MHHGARREVIPAGATGDQVGGNGERSAGETDEGGGFTEFVDDELGFLFDDRCVTCRDAGELGHIGSGADRLVDHWPHARLDVHPHPGQGQRHHDVGVQHSRIHLVSAHRLAGDLGGEIRGEARLQHRRALTSCAVLGQGTPGLAHEPHRMVIGALAGHRGQKGWSIHHL